MKYNKLGDTISHRADDMDGRPFATSCRGLHDGILQSIADSLVIHGCMYEAERMRYGVA